MATTNEIIFTVALSNGEDFDVSYDNVGTDLASGLGGVFYTTTG